MTLGAETPTSHYFITIIKEVFLTFAIRMLELNVRGGIWKRMRSLAESTKDHEFGWNVDIYIWDLLRNFIKQSINQNKR